MMLSGPPSGHHMCGGCRASCCMRSKLRCIRKVSSMVIGRSWPAAEARVAAITLWHAAPTHACGPGSFSLRFSLQRQYRLKVAVCCTLPDKFCVWQFNDVDTQQLQLKLRHEPQAVGEGLLAEYMAAAKAKPPHRPLGFEGAPSAIARVPATATSFNATAELRRLQKKRSGGMSPCAGLAGPSARLKPPCWPLLSCSTQLPVLPQVPLLTKAMQLSM